MGFGRDGTLFSEDSRHLLAIAKPFGVEQIPVRVLVLPRQSADQLPTTGFSTYPIKEIGTYTIKEHLGQASS